MWRLTVAEAAIGFADHSGWAIAVAIVPAGRWFEVVARERLEIVEPGWALAATAFALPRQPYHAVAEQGADRDVIQRTIASSADASEAAIGRLAETIASLGHELRFAGVPIGTARLPESLDAILGSHTLLHAAEGELFREALAEGAARCSLVVSRMPRKEAMSLAAAAAGRATGEFDALLTAFRTTLGPPWQADHKLAAAAACLALAGAQTASDKLSP
jgi:hypothetical protein